MTRMICPIKTEEDYQNALKRVEQLMDARPGSQEGDELEVLATLVELFENEHFPIAMPSATEAIRFRMDQQDLSSRDLEPFIGSRGKVSEVLSGKRPLTLQMIRSLHTHLGIPADVLLQKSGASLPESPSDIDWSRFPIKAMAKMGWLERVPEFDDRAEEIMRGLIERAGGFDAVPQALFRKNETAPQNSKMDPYALKAWCYQLLALARQRQPGYRYVKGSVTIDFCRRLTKLSWSQDGPRLAREFLQNHGIHLIHLPHLPRTYLDGAVLQLSDGTPVIGLTLRYDRLDNFWFCLCHELGHVAIHMQGEDRSAFIDDLTIEPSSSAKLSKEEHEADEWAQESLIPSEEWNKSGVSRRPSAAAVTQLAHVLGIHPAIVAGRVRKERRNYRMLTHYVGTGEVRRTFASN
jgi:HTH-type transcriptional regulator / antitoxin HigA